MKALTLVLSLLFSSPSSSLPYWSYAELCVMSPNNHLYCREASARPNEACWCVYEYYEDSPEPFCMCKAPVDMDKTEWFEYLTYWNKENEEDI